MEIEKELIDLNGSIALLIPRDVAKWLGLEKDSIVILKDVEEAKIRRVSIWKKETKR